MNGDDQKSRIAPSDEWVAQVRDAVLDWGAAHSQSYPWRAPGLPAWQGLIAEFLLLRTRADQAAPVFESIQRRYPDARSLGDAPKDRLNETIVSLGLSWRQPLFVQLARAIADCDGEIPLTVDGLKELPGVGDYVAAATAAFHGGNRAAIVDANIVRLLCRLIGEEYDGETRRKRWLLDLADRLTPEADFRDYGYAALDLSMTVCRPRQPLCADCPLIGFCVTGRVNTVDEFAVGMPVARHPPHRSGHAR